MDDKINPTHVEKHNGHVNSFPKNPGLYLTQKFLQPLNILPNTTILVIP
jgi:hypothetical protein